MKKKLCYFGKKMQFCLTQSIRKHEGDIFNRYSPSPLPTAENYPVQQVRKFFGNWYSIPQYHHNSNPANNRK